MGLCRAPVGWTVRSTPLNPYAHICDNTPAYLGQVCLRRGQYQAAFAPRGPLSYPDGRRGGTYITVHTEYALTYHIVTGYAIPHCFATGASFSCSLALRPVELGMSLTPSSRGLFLVAASRLNPKSLAAQDDDDTSGHLLEGSWGGEGGGFRQPHPIQLAADCPQTDISNRPDERFWVSRSGGVAEKQGPARGPKISRLRPTHTAAVRSSGLSKRGGVWAAEESQKAKQVPYSFRIERFWLPREGPRWGMK